MSTILNLLALLVGATAVSAIEIRMSLYFYWQDVCRSALDERTLTRVPLTLGCQAAYHVRTGGAVTKGILVRLLTAVDLTVAVLKEGKTSFHLSGNGRLVVVDAGATTD